VTDTIAVIRAEAARLAQVARSEPHAPIPRYAGWSMTDLIGHTGSVHQRTIHIATTLPTENPGREPAPPLDPPELIDWFEAGANEMADLLADGDPSQAVWGFGPDPTIGFWTTRMALETAVHRIDAEEAVGMDDDLDQHLSALGIDEFGIMWLAGLPVPENASGGYVALEPTDLDVRWVISAGESFSISRDSDTPAQASFSDIASDLYLFLLGRIPHHRLTATGDPGAVQAFVGALDAQNEATL